jgi:Zn-dependent protease
MGTTTPVPGSVPGTGTAHERPRQYASYGWADSPPPPPSPSQPPAPSKARHALTVGRIAGIPLELHWSFFALLALVVLAQLSGGAAAVGAGLAWIGILFASVVVHEVAHCVVARRRGVQVLGILLLPIGGMSRMGSLPGDPAGEAAVAAAGPAASFAIGAVAIVAGALLGSHVFPPTLVVGSWWARVGWLNVFLGAFNLLPGFPMDGGRLLRAALARRRTPLAATRIAVRVAYVVAVGLVVTGIVWDLWLVVIGVFVYLGATAELAQAYAAEFRSVARRLWRPGPAPPPPTRWQPPPEWGPPTGAAAPPEEIPSGRRR